MAINSLLNETLKYLETDENNKPKYRFDIYTSGISNYYKSQISVLSKGLIKTEQEKEETIPVSVYTIGDVFNTVSRTGNDVLRNIQALPGTLENIKVSLKSLGYTSLNKAIDTIKAAVVPIEVLQTVEQVYRVAKPLVDKIVNIAAIRFHFVNAALVAQDVLQYLTRVAASTAKNFLNKLWNIFMNTPIFAIYENDNSVNLAEVYSELSDRANAAFEDIVKNLDSIGELMEYINGPERIMYEPKYNELGIAISDDIVDIYHNSETREIFIASSNAIYKVEKDYSTTKLYETTQEIRKLYVYNGNLYYITGDRTIVRPYDGYTITISGEGKLDVVFAETTLLCDNKNFYNGLGGSIGVTANNIQCHCFDIEDNIVYFIDKTSNNYSLFELVVNTDGEWTAHILASDLDKPFGMSYFDGMIYLVVKDSADEYYLTKLRAGYSFDSTDYKFNNVANENKTKNIIWTDGTYATDGTNIFDVSTANGIKNFTFKTTTNNPVNCVTKETYNGINYLVCTGGIRIYVSEIGQNNTYRWNEKYLTYSLNTDLNAFKVPDNIAGCLWHTNNYGRNFIAYSQNTVYLVGPGLINQIFKVDPIGQPGVLLYKEKKSFEEWWDNNTEDTTPKNIECTSETSVGSNIITSIKEINGKLYISLYNPDSENSDVKCGIYPASVNKNKFEIDYTSPVVALNKQSKIYSFDCINGIWYYTDGEYLYSPNYNSKYNLNCGDDDRAVLIDGELNIYTAKKLLKKIDGKSYGDLTTLVNYKTTSDKVQTAYTRNTCMFSDGDYVYNIIDNGEDDIDYDLFQICYKRGVNDFRLIQSNDAAFIVSKNVIKKVPLYSTVASSDYGCGYYTDTTLNKWFNAAPYYLVSNVLNEKKQAEQRDIFLLRFRENFKVELDKLLREIPDAFIAYSKDKLVEELKKSGVTIEGDDGQILNLIIDSVADTTANSFGVYIQQKVLEKIGDDMTYNTFADAVYEACLADTTNNMTEDFYKIFMELLSPIVDEAIKTPTGISEYLLRYYQNHKAEWAKSMTDLIDVDKVDPEIYEMPLKSTESIDIPQTTYKYSYNENNYIFDYIPNLKSDYPADKIVEGYLREVDGKLNFYKKSIAAVQNSELDENIQYYIYNDGEYQEISYSDIKTYYTRELYIDPELDITYYVRSGAGTAEDPYVYYEVYNNSEMDLTGNTKYYTCDTSNYTYVPIDYYDADVDEIYYVNNGGTYTEITFDLMEPEGTYYSREYAYNEITETFTYTIVEDNSVINTDSNTYYIRTGEDTYTEVTDVDSISHLTYYTYEYEIIDERILIKDDNDVPLYYTDKDGNVICYYKAEDETYYTNKEEVFDLTDDTTVESGKTYYEKTGNGSVEYQPTTDTEEVDGKTYYAYGYSMSGDLTVDPEKTYYKKLDDGFSYQLMIENPLPLDSYYEKQEYDKTSDTSVDPDKEYYIQSFKEATSLTDTQYYELGYKRTTDTVIVDDKRYFEVIDFSEFVGEPYYLPQANGNYKQVYVHYDVSVDPDTTYYAYDGNNYVEVTDWSTIEANGTYYTRSGSGQGYVYNPITDLKLIIPGEVYYTVKDGVYTEIDASTVRSRTYYNFYYSYTQVADLSSINSSTTYYVQSGSSYTPVSGSTILSKTYYSQRSDYVLVPDLCKIQSNNTYYAGSEHVETSGSTILNNTYYRRGGSGTEEDPYTYEAVNISTATGWDYYTKEGENNYVKMPEYYLYTYVYDSISPSSASGTDYYERTGGSGTWDDPYTYTHIPTYNTRREIFSIIDIDTAAYGNNYYVASGGAGIPEDPFTYTQVIYYTRSGDPYVYTEVSVQGDTTLNPENTYFIDVDGEFKRVDGVDEQGGPYYIAAFKYVGYGNGDHIKTNFNSSNAKPYYLPVSNPQQNNISSYYEMDYVKVKKPSSYAGYYIKEFIKVNDPNNVDLTDYYEKKTDAYVATSDVSYVYDNDGIIVGIVNDRNFYKATTSAGEYEEVQNPAASDNPMENNWYEKIFVPRMSGTFINPAAEGLFERVANDVDFVVVENPSGNPRENGWYEITVSYSVPYFEDKVYVDLGNFIVVPSLFPPEDNDWHHMFYNYAEEAKGRLPEGATLEELKAAALLELNKLQYIIYPSWLWQSLITMSVTELYIPTQGDQYRQIILESNMYPIHWDELPPEIDHDAFDYALTALLYAVKQRLMTNISILVDQGTVKCYSCIDGFAVIRKMVEKNGNIWYNQLKRAKKNVNEAETEAEVLSAFDMMMSYNTSLGMLENILNDQSALYAKYIDMIIEEQVINDNDTEVVL